MIANHNNTKRSKTVMAFWMEKGWMQYVSLKKGSYRNVQGYVIELFRERENLMDKITNCEVDIDEGIVIKTPELERQMKEWEEIYETIDLELHMLHDRHESHELYQAGHRYRGFEVYTYEDDLLFEGLYCKIENLDYDFPDGEDYATYLHIDTPVTISSLFHIADNILDLQTNLGDPAIEMTLLSEKDVEGQESYINVSKHIK